MDCSKHPSPGQPPDPSTWLGAGTTPFSKLGSDLPGDRRGELWGTQRPLPTEARSRPC